MQDKDRTLVISDATQLHSPASRRGFLRAMGLGGAVVLLPSAFAACKDSTSSLAEPDVQQAAGGGDPVVILDLNTDVGILNYAYALEQLEAAFYTAVVGASVFSQFTPEQQEIMNDLREHEVIHREFLRAAIAANGGTPLPALSANFATTLTSTQSILNAAMAFEDLGVAAYNGAGKYLTNTTFLTLAGKIVSVEARHAAAIRDTMDTTGRAFATFSNEAALGASNSNALDGALEPTAVFAAVGATGVLRTPVRLGALPAAVA